MSLSWGQEHRPGCREHKQPLSWGQTASLEATESTWFRSNLAAASQPLSATGEDKPLQWREWLWKNHGKIDKGGWEKNTLGKNSSEALELHNGGVWGREGKYSCFLRQLQEIMSGCEKQGSLWTKKKEKKRRGVGESGKGRAGSVRDRGIKKHHGNNAVHLPLAAHPQPDSFLTHFENKLVPTSSGRWANPESSLNPSSATLACLQIVSKEDINRSYVTSLCWFLCSPKTCGMTWFFFKVRLSLLVEGSNVVRCRLKV